ncbi:hypothetical protein HKX48_001997, partial [Thoreauomyces humboldtii]
VDVTEADLVEVDTVANLAKRAQVVKKWEVLARATFALFQQQVEPQWATARFAQLEARLNYVAARLANVAA